ncbi:MAG TPA: RNase H family protein [Planctomycetota bacterium]|nr:RNase H family protein [Planctomycetota bacterium]
MPARPAADTVDLFCAVACSPVTGNGAWACVLRSGDARKTLRGFEADTTPNRLALLAVLSGLAALTRPGPVRVFCADDYVVEGATRWLRGWQQRGWRTSAGREVAHRELWEGLARRLGDHVVWVPTGGCAPPPLMREAKAAALAAVERTDGA